MLSLLLRNQLSPVCFFKGCVFFTLEITTVVSPKLWCTYLAIHPQEFCWKTYFKASRAVFWSLSGYKEVKHTTKPFTGPALDCLLISLGICRKQIFDGFNSETAVLTISFGFLSSPPLSLFMPRVFFCRAFTTVAEFILAGKVFGEAFRMKEKVGGQWKKNFMGILRVNFTVFFFYFSTASFTESCLSGVVSKVFSPCTSQRTKLSLTVNNQYR